MAPQCAWDKAQALYWVLTDSWLYAFAQLVPCLAAFLLLLQILLVLHR